MNIVFSGTRLSLNNRLNNSIIVCCFAKKYQVVDIDYRTIGEFDHNYYLGDSAGNIKCVGTYSNFAQQSYSIP